MVPSGQVNRGCRADTGEAAGRKNPKIFKTHKQRAKDLNGDLSTSPKHHSMLKSAGPRSLQPRLWGNIQGQEAKPLWLLWYFSRNPFLHTQASSSRTTPLKTEPLCFGTWWKQVCLVGSLVWTEKFWICPGIKAISIRLWKEDFHCWVVFHTPRPASFLHLVDTVDPRTRDTQASWASSNWAIRSSAWRPANLPLASDLHPREVTLSSVTSWSPVRPYSHPTQILRPQLESIPSI